MFCNQCGQKLKETALFCPNCGAPTARVKGRSGPEGPESPKAQGTPGGPETPPKPEAPKPRKAPAPLRQESAPEVQSVVPIQPPKRSGAATAAAAIVIVALALGAVLALRHFGLIPSFQSGPQQTQSGPERVPVRDTDEHTDGGDEEDKSGGDWEDTVPAADFIASPRDFDGERLGLNAAVAGFAGSAVQASVSARTGDGRQSASVYLAFDGADADIFESGDLIYIDGAFRISQEGVYYFEDADVTVTDGAASGQSARTLSGAPALSGGETAQPLPEPGGTPAPAEPAAPIQIPEHTQELHVVSSGSSASLSLRNWESGQWTEVFTASAQLGSNGVSASKQEGDRCTPAGTFDILFAFGTAQRTLNIPYVQIVSGDVWVCDPDSAYYNTLQKSGSADKDWDEVENLYDKFSKDRSVACIYFGFNGDGYSAGSARTGVGSDLFIDGVGSAGNLASGYGDIKISAADMDSLLALLDSARMPQVVIS